jgi:2-dehydro-3-deoxygluconokinase
MPHEGVAAVGECMIELSQEPGGLWRLGYAGDSFNTLWALRAILGPHWRTSYVSAFGDERFSQAQREMMRAAGIDTAESPVIPGARPGLYAISLQGAERSFTYWRADAAARALASDPAALGRSLAGRALVYVSGITLGILAPEDRLRLLAALAAARREGARIAFDPNYRARLWPDAAEARAAITAALRLSDIALPTHADERALFGDADAAATLDRIAAAGVAEAAVKDGPAPALVLAGGLRTAVPAEPIADPADTTGAGDAFNGGFLAGRLLGLDPVAAARRGHRTAAAVIRRPGAIVAMEVLRAAFGDQPAGQVSESR